MTIKEIIENEIILLCCPLRISNKDVVRIDIDTEDDSNNFDYYILNQQEYYNYEDCDCMIDIDEEPESTLLFVFEPNFLKKLTGGLNND